MATSNLHWYTGWWILLIPLVVGLAVWYVEAGGLEPLRKQVVIEEVSRGHYTVSECVAQHPCSITKVAHSPLEVYALTWAYLSGKSLHPDWSEP